MGWAVGLLVGCVASVSLYICIICLYLYTHAVFSAFCMDVCSAVYRWHTRHGLIINQSISLIM